MVQQNIITTIISLFSPLLLSRPSLSLPLSLTLSHLIVRFLCFCMSISLYKHYLWIIASEWNLIHPNNRFIFFGKVCITLEEMSHTLLAISLILLGLTIGGNSLQTDIETKVDLLKSLIYDNTKATVTLDSAALKQLIQFSSV